MSSASRSRTSRAARGARGGGPLRGLRVVALEHAVAAPLCSRHLADLGADVVKVEPPEGDFARRYDTVVKGQSTNFVWLNRGKRSAVLDLHADDDRAVFAELLARADVFLHNLGPGSVERLGFGWETLHPRHPRLIDCAVSGYGVDGPYRDRTAFDLLLQGESGVIAVTGAPDAPAKVGISIADIAGGMYALASILAALHERDATGLGTFIDVSLFDCLAEWMSVPLYLQRFGGAAPERTGMRHNLIRPYGPYRVADGSTLLVAVQNEGQWERLCRVALGRAELARDPRFATNELRLRNASALEPIVAADLARLDRAEAVRRLEAADVPYGALNEVADVVRHPQLVRRGRWREAATPAGAIEALADPFNLLGAEHEAGRVPALGEHTEEIRRELRTRRTDTT